MLLHSAYVLVARMTISQSGIQLFRRRLSKKSVKACATMPKPYAFTLFWDNLRRNSCIGALLSSTSLDGIPRLR